MGGERPKQFIEVSGRCILEWSIRAFSEHPLIDEICIISRADCIEAVQEVVQRGGYTKVRHVLPGGKERYDSSLAAIHAYEDEACDICLLLHDAVRPLVSQRIISDCLKALEEYAAVNVAIPTTDTIIQVNSQGVICQTPARASLRNVQTPQGFRLNTIREAYAIALKDPQFQATDDCGVVFRYLPHTPIKVVEGETTNIKITFPQDLLLMEKVLQERQAEGEKA